MVAHKYLIVRYSRMHVFRLSKWPEYTAMVKIVCLYQGGLDRRLPEHERLNVTSCSPVGGKPQNHSFQVCLKTPELLLNA